jgi:hypothetical protein
MSTENPILPFLGNSDEVAAKVIHLHGQGAVRREFLELINTDWKHLTIRGFTAKKLMVTTNFDTLVEACAVHRNSCQSSEPHPPSATAEFLLKLCATSKRADAALGDMNERFARDYLEFGEARARRLYWAQTLRSLLPLLIQALRRGVAWVAVADALKRHFLG